MILTPIAIASGLVVGLLRGGRLANILNVHVIWWPLLAAGLVLQTLAEQVGIPLRLSAYVVGAFFMIVALMQNVHIRGAGVTAFGLALNLFVTVANGHIPTRLEALIGAGRVPEDVDPDSIVAIGGLGELETDATSLAVLGDIVPISFFDEVVSFGDLILTAGIFVIAMNIVGTGRRAGGISVDEFLAGGGIDLRDDSHTDSTSHTDTVDLTEPGLDLEATSGSFEPDPAPREA